MQKVIEAELTQKKLKRKRKVNVVDLKMEEAQKEKVAKLKAEIAVNLEMIAHLEG
jgi:hypothetical protein